jgi:hypothetical protein
MIVCEEWWAARSFGGLALTTVSPSTPFIPFLATKENILGLENSLTDASYSVDC